MNQVRKSADFYCIKITDIEKTYHIVVKINLSDCTVTKSRVLKGVSECDFFGDAVASDGSTNCDITPLITYLDHSSRIIVVEKAISDMDISSSQKKWFEKMRAIDCQSISATSSMEKQENTNQKTEADAQAGSNRIEKDTIAEEYKFLIQAKQTVMSLKITEYFGRTVLLLKNIFNNLILSQNPTDADIDCPFNINLTKLPLKLEPNEEVVSFSRIAGTKFICLVSIFRLCIIDG